MGLIFRKIFLKLLSWHFHDKSAKKIAQTLILVSKWCDRIEQLMNF